MINRSGDNVQKITLLLTFLLTVALSTVIIVFFDNEKSNVNQVPKELYQVYLAGEKIGIVASKQKLEAYIDKKQEEIKTKYNVKNVYPPKDLNIQKYISYGDNDKVLSEAQVYDLIKEKNPFTVKGYVIKIKTAEPKIINVLDKSIFTDAVTKTIEAFVPKEDYENFINNKQPEINGTGKLIEDLYISEDITIKEAYISTDEHIYTDENELAKYLLFGTLSDQQKYVVQDGETIDQIAFNHQLGTEEFLIVNPEFSKPNSLLFPGQEVSVGLIQPIFDVVVEEHVVEDQTVKFETETVDDNTLAAGTTQVKQEGVDGVSRVIQKLQVTNGVITGVEIDRAATQVIKEPVKKIVVRGTKSSIPGGTATISPDGQWYWPTTMPYKITTYYGYRWGQLHAAIDIAGVGYGSPVYVARTGIVFTSGYDSTRGNYLVVAHDSNYFTIYLHLSKKYVSVGQSVKGGQVIAAVGNSGYVVGATGTHLHFGVQIGEPYKSGTKTINPLTLYK